MQYMNQGRKRRAKREGHGRKGQDRNQGFA
jgi:hypothetical protein